MKILSKYLILITLISPGKNHASLLHDFIRAGDFLNVEVILKRGSKSPCFKPDAIDLLTQESTLEALEHCKLSDNKARILELLNEYCAIYNVKIPQGLFRIYPESIAKRKAPAFEKGSFIANKHIKEVFLPEENAEIVRVGKTSQAIQVGQYFVLQQRNSKNCGPATVLMRQLDLGVEPSTAWFSSQEQSGYPDLMSELNNKNIIVERELFKGAKLKVKNNNKNEPRPNIAQYLQDNIPQRGPAIVNGFNQQEGGHWFIVDEVSIDNDNPAKGFAIIRDPWHGWRVRISQKAFLSIVGLDPDFQSNQDDELWDSMADVIWTSVAKIN